jgi:hypothetical protein
VGKSMQSVYSRVLGILLLVYCGACSTVQDPQKSEYYTEYYSFTPQITYSDPTVFKESLVKLDIDGWVYSGSSEEKNLKQEEYLKLVPLFESKYPSTGFINSTVFTMSAGRECNSEIGFRAFDVEYYQETGNSVGKYNYDIFKFGLVPSEGMLEYTEYSYKNLSRQIEGFDPSENRYSMDSAFAYVVEKQQLTFPTNDADCNIEIIADMKNHELVWDMYISDTTDNAPVLHLQLNDKNDIITAQ